MQPYVKTYLKYFGLDVSDFIACEYCEAKAAEIHHLTPRSLNRSLFNKIENLMALCRNHHDQAGASKRFNDELRIVHRKKLLTVNSDHETIKL